MNSLNNYIIISLVILGLSISVYARDGKKVCVDESISCLENIDIELKNGSIILTCTDDEDNYVEITEDYDLIINDRLIKTNNKQRKLLADYHDQLTQIVDYAKDLGKEGAKIGLRGAKIGLKAIAGIFKLLRSDYDSDDLEAELEREAEKLELEAEKLEEAAEDLEYLAEEFEESHSQLKEEIPELDKLEWF